MQICLLFVMSGEPLGGSRQNRSCGLITEADLIAQTNRWFTALGGCSTDDGIAGAAVRGGGYLF